MRFINDFLIRFSSKKIGNDEFGNEYFESKDGKRRFVIYKGEAEPSKIPAEWHGWIHHNTDSAPVQINTHKFSWQKIHLPNLTGTKNAYKPKNTSNKDGWYESWKAN